MLLKFFLFSVAIRWAYAILMFATMGSAGLQGVDSIGYLTYANDFAQIPLIQSLHGLEWIGPNPAVMPLFRWLIGLNALVFGPHAALTYVLTQGLMDAGTCLLIYGIAHSINPRIALLALITATLNPTQIVLSGIVYTDTPFLFFTAVFFFASLRWMHEPTWRWASLVGLGLGLATLTRALAAPWAPLLLIFLLIVAILRKRQVGKVALQLAAAAAIFAIFVAPVIWRNLSEYGAWSLTSQGGTHLSLWVAPLVQESKDGTPWQTSYETMQRRILDRYPEPTNNPFEQSRRATEIAREALTSFGPVAIVKAWAVGAAINLMSPAVILSPPISHLPRIGFYGTPGASPLSKIYNFLFHSENAAYAWILIVGIFGVGVVRIIQLAGLVVLFQSASCRPAMCLFALWILYILAINGPVASPKYRLPLETPLVVLAAAGFDALRRKLSSPSEPL